MDRCQMTIGARSQPVNLLLSPVASSSAATTATSSQSGHKCITCDKVFDKKYKLNKHFKKHDPKHRCDICDKKFQYPRDLTRHRSDKHPDTFPSPSWYCCYQGCEYSKERGPGFRRKENLTRHLKSQHPSG
ncbi:hypothetical protein F4775DRAFT_600295 [Biscogniauxia sp. FL1348]|nr:hypothetical protein F4775DRAFT_600295 [Biscogniauxia sp. FL1348]